MKSISWAVFILVILAILIVLPMMHWGSMVVRPPQTITVSGEAESQVANQIASFNAGLWATNDDRQTAISEVNAEMDSLKTALEDFGIPEGDIQTQNVSVYQETFPSEDDLTVERGQWRASNNIVVTLRDINRANELMNLLGEAELTDISGPNFRIDDSSEAQTRLLTAAVANAREKADLIADDQGHRITRVLSISEGAVSGGNFLMSERMDGLGGGYDLAPGTSTVGTTVTVVFEMR
ncbi:MAG: SIMPL domain-containing protein [Patescibacteria group bacterium]